MKGIMVFLMLGVIPAFGGSRTAPIRLYTQFQHQPPDAVLEAIQEELQNVMMPAGIDFEWRSLANSMGNEVSVELAVIHFKGTCALTDLAPTEIYPGPLGWTHMSDGEILPFSDINCDGIRGFIQRGLLQLPEAVRETAYGRAIARVLAHELYHILAKTTKHAAWGIGKPAYTVQELLSTRFEFEKKQCDTLKAHQARLALIGGDAGQ